MGGGRPGFSPAAWMTLRPLPQPPLESSLQLSQNLCVWTSAEGPRMEDFTAAHSPFPTHVKFNHPSSSPPSPIPHTGKRRPGEGQAEAKTLPWSSSLSTGRLCLLWWWKCF